MHLKSLIAAVALTVCLPGISNAQQPNGQVTNTGLALEVTYLKGRPPGYQSVAGRPQKEGSWYALFGRVAGWQLPAGALPVRAVRIVPYVEGDAVRINVSILRGIVSLDVEEKVATYSQRENEQLSVAALTDFGVEPFEIKVLRILPQITGPPSVIINAKSVEVVGIEALVSTFPSYKFTLHNLSDKNITALKVNVMVEGKVQLTGMPQGKDGEPLIKAGGYYELKPPLSTSARATPGGYIPVSPSLQQIFIAAVVYEDGTHEGEDEGAATYRGFALGRQTELKRLVAWLDSVLASSLSTEEVRVQLKDLPYDVDAADLEALASAFPAIDRMRFQSSTAATIHGLRKDLLEELRNFQQSEHSDVNLKIWLTSVKERYSNWLLQINSHYHSQR